MAARAAQGQALRKYFFARYLESDEFKFPWDRAVLQRRARRRERAVRRRRHVNTLQGAGRGNDSKSRSVVFRRRKEREQARAGDRRHSSDARPQCGEEPKLCCGPEMKAAKPGTPLRKLFGVDSEGNTAAALKLSHVDLLRAALAAQLAASLASKAAQSDGDRALSQRKMVKLDHLPIATLKRELVDAVTHDICNCLIVELLACIIIMHSALQLYAVHVLSTTTTNQNNFSLIFY